MIESISWGPVVSALGVVVAALLGLISRQLRKGSEAVVDLKIHINSRMDKMIADSTNAAFAAGREAMRVEAQAAAELLASTAKDLLLAREEGVRSGEARPREAPAL